MAEHAKKAPQDELDENIKDLVNVLNSFEAIQTIESCGGHANPEKSKRIAGRNWMARLIAIACSQPPEGYSRWSVRLLANRLVELEIVDAISHMTIQRVMKKTNSNHG